MSVSLIHKARSYFGVSTLVGNPPFLLAVRAMMPPLLTNLRFLHFVRSFFFAIDRNELEQCERLCETALRVSDGKGEEASMILAEVTRAGRPKHHKVSTESKR